ncbi:MAG TPA: class I SAM-dependent methyltransferase [Candidatus Acidoferrales bacterium]|nr:class I SAM-dependent methyltransferase [Candidatus Acidoferrales bacterium]
MASEKDYILGTHDEEISRLGLQHLVWRPRALDTWKRAGFSVGQTIIDIGCGPGYAAFDLSEIVGASGHIFAIDRSRRFLDNVESARDRRGYANITAVECDLDEEDFQAPRADGAWCRWIFSFVKRPHELVSRIARSLKKNGVIVLHEYFDYSTWRFAPRSGELEEFVEAVMGSWRASGGEPDIGLNLPVWLEECGFEITEMKPIIDIVPASSFVWQWPRAFINANLDRLVELGRMDRERAREILRAVDACEKRPGTLMITPAVVEIIALLKNP